MTLKDKTIAMASDHAGFALKEKIRLYLIKQGYSVIDCGAYSEDSVDYPDYIKKAAGLVSKGRINRAIILCGSGVGASLVANKHPKVRAALVWTPKLAVLSREHNNANVLVLPGRFVGFSKAKKITKNWLNTAYSNDARHSRRLAKLRKIEKKFTLLFMFIFMLFFSLFSFAKTLKWEKKDLSVFETQMIGLQKDDKGYYLALKYQQPQTNKADLYLNFNKKRISDLMRHYKIKQQNIIQDKKFSLRQTQTAGFLFPYNKILIKTKKNNFLNEQTDLESFTISFWVYASSKTSSVIFRKGTFQKEQFYGVEVKVFNNRLYFTFSNFFFDIYDVPHSYSLSAPAVSETWVNYCLTFDKRIGKLTLYKNNIEEDTAWTTETHTAESAVYSPHFQGYSDLIIGEAPFGYLDDFIIYKYAFDAAPDFQFTKTVSADLISPVVVSDTFDTVFHSIIINTEKPSDIDIRGSNQVFTEDAFSPQWKTVFPVKGKFFQFRYKLNSASKIYSIQAVLNEQASLEPPKVFSLYVQTNSLTIQWDPIQDKRAAGYYLYIRDKNNTVKKIDCHNTTEFVLSHLKYNEPYYIALSVYDKAHPANESVLSEEKKIILKQ